MSIRLMDLALRSPLGSTQKLVLIVLSNAANDDGVAWPRQETIATQASTTDRTVRRVLEDLERIGLVSWEQRGLRRSNLYRINVERLRELVSIGSAWTDEESGPDDPERTRVSGPERTESPVLTGHGRPVPSEPSEEPSEEPSDNVGTRRRDLLFEAICEVCGIDWTRPMTRSSRGQINSAAKQLREIDATPDEIRRVATAYRVRWPNVDLTPSALVKHWNLARAPLPGQEEAIARAKRRMIPPPPDERPQLENGGTP